MFPLYTLKKVSSVEKAGVPTFQVFKTRFDSSKSSLEFPHPRFSGQDSILLNSHWSSHIPGFQDKIRFF
ncbi:hypothetical protein DLM78_20140 [Leptospira stimsonii]|uniref:Uncharacterized protein n=1 Tax=Leptospira stimsonii TaxID=2202203 RepID=A0A8B3CN83_9LEPT|nr:hypothetical protein DLM78_20140 [Leptospira stimsonii]